MKATSLLFAAFLAACASPLFAQTGEIIVESSPDGQNFASFQKVDGAWLESTAKSKAPGLKATAAMYKSLVAGGAARFAPDIPADGKYDVYVTYPDSGNASGVIHKVHSASGDKEIVLDQNGRAPTADPAPNVWIPLGTYEFKKGTDGFVEVRDPGTGKGAFSREPNTRMYADAVRFVPNTTGQEIAAAVNKPVEDAGVPPAQASAVAAAPPVAAPAAAPGMPPMPDLGATTPASAPAPNTDLPPLATAAATAPKSELPPLAVAVPAGQPNLPASAALPPLPAAAAAAATPALPSLQSAATGQASAVAALVSETPSPIAPAAPALPPLGAAPAVPATSALPSLPGALPPAADNAPPAAPALPPLPGAPTTQMPPTAPSAPALPPLGAAPAIPATSALPPLPGALPPATDNAPPATPALPPLPGAPTAQMPPPPPAPPADAAPAGTLPPIFAAPGASTAATTAPGMMSPGAPAATAAIPAEPSLPPPPPPGMPALPPAGSLPPMAGLPPIPGAGEPAPPMAPPATAGVPGASDLSWVFDIGAAQTIAEKSNKPILVFFTAEGNKRQAKYEAEFFSNPAVRSQLDRFVLMRSDFPANTRYAYKLGVYGAGNIVVIDRTEEVKLVVDEMPSTPDDLAKKFEGVK